MSLAGAQDKLPVRLVDGCFALPLGTAASTHILKLATPDFEGLVFNEAFSADGLARLAPLYDLVSTVFYPNLAPEMAMRIGAQAISDRVTALDLERLAREAGLAPPLVRRRAAELAEIVLDKVNDVEQPNTVSESIAALVSKRAATFKRRFN